MTIRRFLIRRLVLAAPLLVGVALLTFMLVRVGGQDPVGLLAGPTADAAEIAAIRADLGLDRPVWEQFGIYLARVVRGDLGASWLSNRPVLDDIVDRLPVTLELLLAGVGAGALVGVLVGLHAAFHPGGRFDHVSRVVSLVGFSIPTYWLGLVAIFVCFYLLGWAPAPLGRIDIALSPPPRVTGSYVIDALVALDLRAARSAMAHLALPAAVLAIIAAAPVVKQTRAIALAALSSDFVRHARASGLGTGAIRRMVLRNSVTPIVTFIGSELISLFGTSSLIELVFAWGGLGQYGLNAILSGDFTAVQGYVLSIALFSLLVFAVVDLLVAVCEPRAGLT